MDCLLEPLYDAGAGAGALLICSLLFLYLLRSWPIWSRRRNLPPGPKGLPIIGNMQILDQLTHRGLAKLCDQYGGIVHLRLGAIHSVAVATPAAAREALQLRDHVFSNRPATTAVQYLTYERADMAFAHYGPFWRQMRKLCVMKLFSRRRTETWVAVRDEVDSLVGAAGSAVGKEVNVGELVFTATRNIIYRAAFGSRSHEGQDEFVKIMQEFSKLMGAFNVVDFMPEWLRWIDPQGFNKRLRAARGSLDRFIDHIIDEHMVTVREGRKAEEECDMVDDLISFVGDESVGGNTDGPGLRLHKDNIKAIIMDIMFGGTETVASAIEWAMAELLKTPSELKKVQQELAEVVGLNRKVEESDLDKLKYLKCCVKETLRLHPPIPLLLHQTSEDSEIGGYFVPAGARVSINVWAIGRDPTGWKDPDSFKPGRFEEEGAVDFKGGFFELIPFGSGRRSCPGMQLGLYATELTLAQMLHCFTWNLPVKPSELDMSDEFGLTAPKAHRLVAVPTPRLLCPLF